MTAPRPHDRLISTHATADEALETFTVGLPQWPIFVLLSRNPLVRASDRIQVLAAALAVLVLLLSVPVAAAVGTAVHESRRELYAEHAELYGEDVAVKIERCLAITDAEAGSAKQTARTASASVKPTRRRRLKPISISSSSWTPSYFFFSFFFSFTSFFFSSTTFFSNC